MILLAWKETLMANAATRNTWLDKPDTHVLVKASKRKDASTRNHARGEGWR